MHVVGRVILGHVSFFFQAEDGIRYLTVTGVQTCALPILLTSLLRGDTQLAVDALAPLKAAVDDRQIRAIASSGSKRSPQQPDVPTMRELGIEIGRASCRERV